MNAGQSSVADEAKKEKGGHLNVELTVEQVEFLDQEAARQHHSSRKAIVLQLIDAARQGRVVIDETKESTAA